jgi:hypothetical protein
MKCPVHTDIELRVEHYSNDEYSYRTGFCLKCLKNYNLCRATRHMKSCDKLEGHNDSHQDKDGFKDNFFES